jgi:predicted metal-dependent phosphotriesterase family hydrolase
LKKTAMAATACLAPRIGMSAVEGSVMTVLGPLGLSQLGFTLSHEHVLVDFIGADKANKTRYDADAVFDTALPYLEEVKKAGCKTFIDCTPAFIGRDAMLLRRLSQSTGLNIITTTGYYGAVQHKYVPQHAYSETAEDLSKRWISEWRNGIEGTDIKPGLIKTGVDKGPLSELQSKLVDAAALTHLATGLTIGIHTGDGKAAMEELKILEIRKVSPSARIWIHAQNEKDTAYHIDTAQRGGWVSFDGVNPNSIHEHISFLQTMKEKRLLKAVLVSQDSGWYHVGEPKGGKYNGYTSIFSDFIPALRERGFSQTEIDTIFIENPGKAFGISVRGLK